MIVGWVKAPQRGGRQVPRLCAPRPTYHWRRVLAHESSEQIGLSERGASTHPTTALMCWLTLLFCFSPLHANDITPTGTLRAVYLSSNPAQAVLDRASGAVRGVSADLARELARRVGAAVEINAVATPPDVIDAVGGGAADIGFLAFEPSRIGRIEFSQTYMFVQQSFLVPEGSSISAIADVDRDGQKIAGTRNDSITLYMKRKFRHATLVEIDNEPVEIKRLLLAKEIDAFAANRQRLTTLMHDIPGTRLLAGSLFGVPQTIVVAKDRRDALLALNRFIDDVRASGFLQQVIAGSGIIGLEMAPGGSWQPSVPE
jgi:polar amino acid transport system substrate-binding protein